MSQKFATGLFITWLVLLLPCLFLAPLSLMALGDAGGSKANLFVLSLWTYPVAVAIVAIFRKKAPEIAFLPCVNIVVCVVSGL